MTRSSHDVLYIRAKQWSLNWKRVHITDEQADYYILPISTMAQVNTNHVPDNLFAIPDLVSETDETPPLDVFLSSYHSPFVAYELISTANALVNPRGKGIYATDETPEAIEAAFRGAAEIAEEDEHWGEEDHKDRRRRWREDAYNSLSNEYISGVILFAETLLDFKLAPILLDKGIIPGVRANGELRPIPISPFEFNVQGLDDLLPKLQAARIAGARFSKWRAPIACTSAAQGLPTQAALEAQAETLAQYAAISQEAGLVPIIEPDVEFSADADLARSAEVHERAISLIYARCRVHGVLLEGSLLKPSFPQPGLKHPSRANVIPGEIARATATVLSRSVPYAVPGVVFLSGGLAPAVATSYVAAVNALVNSASETSPFSRLPPLSFSFGRALQGDAMKHWVKGDNKAMEEAFQKWSKSCSLAAKGEIA
ncbi:Fructose-bisphosphate aldolase [Hypsizygus marmoreus]|uniref:Fructose-bisphosphate aldolase n=1 Tax=Hypsizygus marmoreus TaxID=39966 RepID=A0A369JBK4_HYPMA|nr:Fructose-bisphosphate aldolase [Hypsizygus marmoreus]